MRLQLVRRRRRRAACARRDARCFGDAQALVDDDAADFERVVERLFELDVEPVVDRRIEKAQRESVHDDDRRHREQHQHDQQAPAEARARRAALQIDAQAPQTLRDREREQRERGGRRAEDPAVILREAPPPPAASSASFSDASSSASTASAGSTRRSTNFSQPRVAMRTPQRKAARPARTAPADAARPAARRFRARRRRARSCRAAAIANAAGSGRRNEFESGEQIARRREAAHVGRRVEIAQLIAARQREIAQLDALLATAHPSTQDASAPRRCAR